MIDLTPGSPEWTRRVSPSKAAAILGMSPYTSPYAMWRQMRGDIPPDAETPAMERGTLCEDAVLRWWRKHHDHAGWREQHTLTLGDWLVATPDALCAIDGTPVLVEAKTSAADWDGQVPEHYRIQVDLAMHVCHLSGIEVAEAHVPVLGGRRLEFTNHVIPYVPEYGAAILARCQQFYDLLGDDDAAPALDDTVSTWDAVRRVHPDIDRGAEVELSETDAAALVFDNSTSKAVTASLRLAKSTVLEQMGAAQYATCNGVRIARRQPRGDDVTFVVVATETETFTDQGAVA